jgi:ADP-dependent NAD(P)H-hydrate dehydratase / NAD(P)H-hydrate epimerase
MASPDPLSHPDPYVPNPVPLTELVSPPLFRAADIRIIEAHWQAEHPGTALMERAGLAAAEWAGTLARETGEPVLVLAGPGNNGGDALMAACLLAERGSRVIVVSEADPARLPADAARAWAAWHARGGTVQSELPLGQRYSLVIDGLFGVGLQRDVGGASARWIDQVNSMDCPKLALDVPSGLDADSGRVRGRALRADYTLSFLGLKPGLLTADGPDCVGELRLDTLGIAPDSLPATPGIALTHLESRHRLPPRVRNSHKGLYGHLGIIGGAPGMVGACLIAGRAALQQGAGSVTLGVLDARIAVDYGEPRLMFAAPEALVDARLDVLAIGPGLGLDARAHALLDTALAAPCALMLDADALTLLASDLTLAERAAQRSAPTLLTPHPGEAARLLGILPGDVQRSRIDAAQQLSARYRAHIALKGAGTVIAHPDGRYAINTRGGPWLAQAGAGDRLTGMVAALQGQGMAAGDALEAACWLHGSAPAGSPMD